MFNFLKQSWIGQLVSAVNERKKEVKLPVSDEAIQEANFGEVIVIGDESAGKSWVLRRLIQLKIFQCGEDIITRHILRVELRFNPGMTKPLMGLKLPGKQDFTTSDPQLIHDALKASHDEVARSGQGVADIEAILRISCSSVPNIDLIDCPGLLNFPSEGEPNDLPQKVRDILKKYIKKNSIVLHVVDAKANLRNSPAAALLKELTPDTVIKVLTKVDCLVDVRQTGSALGSFLTKFYQEPNAIAVSNYEPYPNATFDDISKEELKCFQQHVPDFEQKKHLFTMDALFSKINTIAEGNVRKDWATLQQEHETKKMEELEHLVKQQGYLYSHHALSNTVIRGILQDDPEWDKLLSKLWTCANEHLPTTKLWEPMEPDIPIELFLNKLEEVLIFNIQTLMGTSPLKLHRFELFQTGLIANLKNKFQERKPYFLERWHSVKNGMMLYHAISPHYDKSQWERAVKVCTYQTIFMHFHPSNVHFTLEQQLLSLTCDLSVEEDVKSQQTRQGLMLQIKEIKNILPMLAN
jgi:GTP-binding protein EngB required for normal cell division